MMKWLRLLSLLCVGVLIASACGVLGGDDSADAPDDDTATGGSEISVGDARITIRSERDSVTVNGDELASGSFQEGAAGDVVAVEGGGTATITAESVVEVEALRSAKVTIPELTGDPITVGLEVGHVFVRLNPDANASIIVDAGERQFATRSVDAEFALCQAPDGASCLAVLRGQVEWIEDGVASEVYNAGEASFAARGNAPDPPRCADQVAIGDMQRSLRGQDFAGALADIVATWDPCDGEGPDLGAVAATLPSAARMEQLSVDEITIGSSDVDADTENIVAERTLDGSITFYVEPLTVTNGEFRTWLVTAAGDDASAWQRFAPQDWLDRAPGGAATQAIYQEGTADEAVQGVGYTTAVEFCASQAKRLVSEIEWELAATNEVLEDLVDEAQDWVSDWQAYGPGPEDSADRQVLRGANAVLEADPYYRVFALDTLDATAARQHARIRCAADEVAVGGRAFANVVFRDDFNSLDWPQIDEDPFELDYHPENYHLDLTAQHSMGTVVRALDDPISNGRIDIDLFIERNNTGSGQGNFRFGTVFGTAQVLHTLTVQPDNFSGDSFLACVMPLDEEMVMALALSDGGLAADSSGRFASVSMGEGHYGEDCVDADSATEVPVTSIDSPLRVTVVLSDGALETWVNDVLVDTSATVPALDVYGFYSQLYHRSRSHIHYDDVIVSTE